MVEADRRTGDARAAFAAAQASAGTAAQSGAVGDAGADFERWVKAVHDEVAMFDAGDHEGAIAASLGRDRELRKTYEQSLAGAQALGDSSILSAGRSVAAASSRSVAILTAVLLLALAIGVGVVYWLMRAIAWPLFRLVTLLTPDLPN